jgi:hypothetical protein
MNLALSNGSYEIYDDVNNVSRLVVDSSGRVGIGTTSPSETLTLNGAAGASLGFEYGGSEVATISNNNAALYVNAGSGKILSLGANGSEKARIDSSGRLGLGTSSPSVSLHVVGDSIRVVNNETINIIPGASANDAGRIQTSSGSALAFATNGSAGAQMTLDTSGRLGIGTTSPAELLHVNNPSATANVRISGGTTAATYSNLSFYGGTTKNAEIYANSSFFGLTASNSNPIRFDTGGSESARIDSSGRLLVGTSSARTNFYNSTTTSRVQIAGTGFGASVSQASLSIVNDTSNADEDSGLLIFGRSYGSLGDNDLVTDNGRLGVLSFQGADGSQLVESASIAAFVDGTSGADDMPGRLVFSTNSGTTSPTERMRIDSSGRLLVGTSTSVTGSAGGFPAASSRLQILGNTTNDAAAASLVLGRKADTTSVSSGNALGQIAFTDAQAGQYASITAWVDGTPGVDDYPGRIVLSTTADGASSPTERMRISSVGQVNTYSTNSSLVLRNSNAAGTTYAFIAGLYSATDAVSGGTVSFRVYNNGDVTNTNNSYGAISDIKLKENIVDANSQWDDLKALQVRNYNLKEGQTHTQIGLIAQEVELVSPGLVFESPDRDEDGNDLGATTKSVNYSVLYMKAVKALQEAMERIEVLEAKVNALEGN